MGVLLSPLLAIITFVNKGLTTKQPRSEVCQIYVVVIGYR